MTENKTKRALLIIKLVNDKTTDRVVQGFPAIKKVIDRFSLGEPLLAFRSNDFFLSGFYMNTGKPFKVIIAELEKCPSTLNGDSFMIVEIGQDFLAAQGFTQAGNWLQHH